MITCAGRVRGDDNVDKVPSGPDRIESEFPAGVIVNDLDIVVSDQTFLVVVVDTARDIGHHCRCVEDHLTEIIPPSIGIFPIRIVVAVEIADENVNLALEADKTAESGEEVEI